MSDVDQHAAYELVMSYRRGWRDGGAALAKRREFMEHATRPDLTAAYAEGYAEGQRARIAVDTAVCQRYGYTPSVLR